MQQLALRCADLGVGNLTQLVVREIVAVRTLLAHNPLLPQFVQRAHRAIFVCLSDVKQQIE